MEQETGQEFSAEKEKKNVASAMHSSSSDEISTKQKILISAVKLFARKGYTETTIRELADAAGLKGASIYNHFPSKNAILEYILEDYSTYNSSTFNEELARAKLRENPTADGVIDCLTLSFPEDLTDYYLKVLCVLLQEQYRNPLIHDFVSSQVILGGERVIKIIFQILKDLKIIRQDADLDPWAKIHSSLLYTFSSRMHLGIGDTSTEYSGMGLVELLRFEINLILTIYAVETKTTAD